jgi:hypothetical protein
VKNLPIGVVGPVRHRGSGGRSLIYLHPEVIVIIIVVIVIITALLVGAPVTFRCVWLQRCGGGVAVIAKEDAVGTPSI